MLPKSWPLVFTIMISCSRAFAVEDGAAQSALASVGLNNSAWKSFDILIEEHVFEDQDKLGVITEKKVFHRIIFDEHLKSGAYFKRGEATKVVPGDQLTNSERQEKQIASGAIVHDGSVVYRFFPNSLATRRELDLKSFYTNVNCPNPTLFGQTLLSEAHDWGEGAEQKIAHLRAVARSYRVTGDSITVETPIPSPLEKREIILLWTIGKHSGFPTECRVATRYLDTKIDYPTMKEFYTWGDIGGVVVPTELYVEEGRIGFDGDEKEFLYLVQTQLKIHWLALNSDHGTQIPPPESLSDLQKFREATDPQLLKSKFISPIP